MKENKAYIIGAGLSGLSAAYHLAKLGYKVEVFESAPHAGGRCRSYFDDKLGIEIDNGNHLIMGANENVLQLIDELGLKEKFNKFDNGVFTFFDNRNGERYYYKAPLPDLERFGVMNMLNLFKFMLLPMGKTVRNAFRLSPNIYYKIINPVSRSILNTPSETADAGCLRKIFLKLVRTKDGFDYFFPKNNWGDALIKPLLDRLAQMDVKINYSDGVKQIVTSRDSAYNIALTDRQIDVANDIVVLASPASVTSKLVDIATPDEFSAIINVHFKLPHDLPPEMIGVINSNVDWIFIKPGVISTTASAATTYLGDAEIVKDAWNMCSKVLGLEKKIPEHRLLIEKRATFAHTKSQIGKRPKQKTKYKNLYLCGDYVDNNLPATIEGAVLSGKNIADLV